MQLSNPKHEKAHKVHLTTVIMAGAKLRSVMIIDQDRIEVLPVCLRSRSCSHCEWILSHYTHTHLGMLKPPTRLSPLEVDAVPGNLGESAQ